MKTCPLCQKEYPDNILFCRSDGSPLKGAESPSSETSGARCKSCGEKVEPDELFCSRCGAKVHAQEGRDSLRARKGSGSEARRFTLGTEESFDRTAEIERPEQAGPNISEQFRSTKKARRGLYAIGGTMVVALVAIFLAPRILDYWRASGPSGGATPPSPLQSPAPQSSPSLGGPSSVPNPEGSTAATQRSTEQSGQGAAVPQETPAPAVSTEPTPPSKSTKHPSKRAAPRGAELAARRKVTPSLPRQEGIQTETKGSPSAESASLKETPVPRRPAEPGTYETVGVAMARRNPSDSAEIVDQIQPRTRLTVTGSEGDWLVVHSKTKNRTVYVKRDDAMFISEKISTAPTGKELEAKWKELERQIQQALSNQGITGVTVSFIRDTAYLKGAVQTEQQRFTAEQTAWSFPEVRYIYNGIWVKR